MKFEETGRHSVGEIAPYKDLTICLRIHFRYNVLYNFICGKLSFQAFVLEQVHCMKKKFVLTSCVVIKMTYLKHSLFITKGQDVHLFHL